MVNGVIGHENTAPTQIPWKLSNTQSKGHETHQGNAEWLAGS